MSGKEREPECIMHGWQVFTEPSKPTPELIEKYRKLVYDIKECIEKTYGVKVKVKESVIKAVIARWERDGFPYCPCKPIASEKTICPCTDIPHTLLKRGHCTCKLYILDG